MIRSWLLPNLPFSTKTGASMALWLAKLIDHLAPHRHISTTIKKILLWNLQLWNCETTHLPDGLAQNLTRVHCNNFNSYFSSSSVIRSDFHSVWHKRLPNLSQFNSSQLSGEKLSVSVFVWGRGPRLFQFSLSALKPDTTQPANPQPVSKERSI